jgi:hypothetical protein
MRIKITVVAEIIGKSNSDMLEDIDDKIRALPYVDAIVNVNIKPVKEEK